MIEIDTVLEQYKQDNTHIIIPVLSDSNALDHFVQFLNLSIDFCCTNANATGIKHRVGSAVYDHATVFSQLSKITMGPNAGKALKVRRSVARAVGIVPESNRR